MTLLRRRLVLAALALGVTLLLASCEFLDQYIPTNALTISFAGAGDGAVEAGAGAGLETVEGERVLTYLADTSVPLQAVAAEGSLFVEWQGACTGTSSSCTVFMDADKSVTAVFDVEPEPEPEPTP